MITILLFVILQLTHSKNSSFTSATEKSKEKDMRHETMKSTGRQDMSLCLSICCVLIYLFVIDRETQADTEAEEGARRRSQSFR